MIRDHFCSEYNASTPDSQRMTNIGLESSEGYLGFATKSKFKLANLLGGNNLQVRPEEGSKSRKEFQMPS
jgi:hypothetical protein